MGERPFEVNLLVQIRAFGLPEHHRSNIIARVTREMEHLFRGEADVAELTPGPLSNGGGNPVWLQSPSVGETEVHRLGAEAQVPEVPREEVAAGSGLRSIPRDVLELRLPVPRQAPNGSTAESASESGPHRSTKEEEA